MSSSVLYKLWIKNKYALLFLSPWFVGVLIFGLIPMVVSLYLSFTTYNMFEAPTWTGLDNYAEILTNDTRFLQSLKVTILYVFIGVPLQLAMAFLLALVLNRGLWGLSLFRAMFYVPSLLGPSVAIAILWRQIFGSEGLFNHVTGIFGIAPKSWVADPTTSLYTLIVLLIWQFGSPMIIFLAGLKQVPQDLYESASMDGAGAVSKFFHITFPMLTPILLFNLIMQVINAFQAFTSAFIVGGGEGGAMDSTLFYTLYLYIRAFNQFEMGYASALAWLLLIIIAFFTYMLFVSSKKWVHYES
ncbi:carbohydrate ABC transporter permease [Paenibacillus sp. TAB 01]|uniref:carbohydrate ABC transporter permease n=1 Tax=Paenibacillus sp. TAB 01 TaxID=3368988 RepID=UPI00375214DE